MSAGSHVHTPYQMPASQPYTPYANPYQSAPVQKKKKKGLLVAVIVVLVLLLAGGGAIALFGKDIQKSLMGPKAAYLMIERESLNGHVDDLIGNLVKYGNKSGRETGGFDMELSILPGSAALESDFDLDPQMITVLENIRFKNKTIYDRTSVDSKVYSLIDLHNKDGRVMTIEILYNNEEMLIHLPDVFDKYMVAAAGEVSTMFDEMQFDLPGVFQGFDVALMAGMFTGSGDLDLGVDEAALNRTLTKIVDIVLDNIDSCELSKNETLRAGDLSASYDMYEMSITTQSARKMLIEIFERLKNDREFYDLFSQLALMVDTFEGGYGDEMSFDDFQEELENAIEELRDPDNEEANFTITQKLYVDKDDQVVGRDLVIVDDNGETLLHFQYAQPASGNREAYLLSLDMDVESYEFLASYTVSNDQKTGTGVLSSMGSEILKIDFKDYRRQEIGSAEWPLGTFDVTIFETDLIGEELPPKISLAITPKGNQLEISLAIPDMIALDMLYAEIAAKDAAIPDMTGKDRVYVDDDEAMDSLLTPDAEEKMMEIMEKLGIDPDDF